MEKISDKITIPIANAYILYQLYSNGFLKSKPVTLATNAYSLQSKLMYIIKSSVNRKIDDSNGIIRSVSFSGNYLSIDVINSVKNIELKKAIISGFISHIISGVDDEISHIINVYFGNSLSYSIYGLFDRYSSSHNNALKEKCDSIVNAIMFIPTSTDLIIKFINDYIVGIEQRRLTLCDLYLYYRYYFSMDSEIMGIELNDRFTFENLRETLLPEEFTYEHLKSIYVSTIEKNFRDLIIENNFGTRIINTNENE